MELETQALCDWFRQWLVSKRDYTHHICVSNFYCPWILPIFLDVLNREGYCLILERCFAMLSFKQLPETVSLFFCFSRKSFECSCFRILDSWILLLLYCTVQSKDKIRKASLVRFPKFQNSWLKKTPYSALWSTFYEVIYIYRQYY